MTAQSPFKLGWLQCHINNGSCAALRRALKSNGWMPMGNNLWMRPGVKHDQREARIADIRHAVPPAANLRFVWVTDHQWGESITVSGANYPRLAIAS